MSMKRSPYQERIIRNYYQNQDAIMLQKVGELISDLYLAEGKARAKLWTRIVQALEKLKVPQERIDKLVSSDNPGLLAKLLEELMAKSS